MYVTDAALVAFLRATGVVDPDAMKDALANTTGLLEAGKMGRRNLTVGPVTFHIERGDAGKVVLVNVTEGASREMSGRAMSRTRYSDRGNNNLGNRRSSLRRKPKGTPRPGSPPTEGEFDD